MDIPGTCRHKIAPLLYAVCWGCVWKCLRQVDELLSMLARVRISSIKRNINQEANDTKCASSSKKKEDNLTTLVYRSYLILTQSRLNMGISHGAPFDYCRWAMMLPASIQICPVEIPGRGRRDGEPHVNTVTMLAETLAHSLPLQVRIKH